MAASVRTKELFTGKERDIETGWDYFGARYYDPAIGRFPTVDPLFDQFPGVSPYSYPFNNPVRYTDPTGMAGEDENDDEEKKKQLALVGEVQKAQNELEKIKAEQPSTGEAAVKALAQTADDVSDASMVGVGAGVAAIVIGAVTGQPEIVAGGIVLTKSSLAAGTTAEGVSFGAKLVDNQAFGGTTTEEVFRQGARFTLSAGAGLLSKPLQVASRTGFLAGPIFPQ